MVWQLEQHSNSVLLHDTACYYVTVTVNNFYPLWVGGSVLQWPALVNTRNVNYWAATFYVSADLCSAGSGSGVRVTWQMATLVLIDVNNPLILPSTHLKLQQGGHTTHKIRFLIRRNWIALHRHCLLYCWPARRRGWKHHNCVKLTVATMTFRHLDVSWRLN